MRDRGDTSAPVERMRAQAKATADPDTDPWGYLIALGELVAGEPAG